jgi:hypothetical protein
LFRIAIIAILCIFIFAKPAHVWAGDFVEDQSSGAATSGESGDSTFDPFSDYSEFEEGSEEEADINFFHNGRFFSIGLLGGYESFTDTLGEIYAPSFQFGLFLEYFFDLKLAMQIAYITATHSETIDSGSTIPFTGSVGINHFEFDLKYYLNTQNVTRGLAALNPYLLIGASTYTRKTNINGAGAEVDDSAFGAQAGGGIEIPLMHNSAFFGIQATYNYIAFPGEGSPITVTSGGNTTSLGLTPNGNALSLMGILGMSF